MVLKTVTASFKPVQSTRWIQLANDYAELRCNKNKTAIYCNLMICTSSIGQVSSESDELFSDIFLLSHNDERVNQWQAGQLQGTWAAMEEPVA
jgi:hypothetical protein